MELPLLKQTRAQDKSEQQHLADINTSTTITTFSIFCCLPKGLMMSTECNKEAAISECKRKLCTEVKCGQAG